MTSPIMPMAVPLTPVFRVLLLGTLCLACASCSMLRSRDKPTSIDEPSSTESSPADLYVAIAAEYARLGQSEAAMKNAEKAIIADRQHYGGYFMLALIYQRLGEAKVADENFKRALDLAPKNPTVLDGYGSYFCTQHRYPEAQAQYAKALENPLYKTPWFTLTNAGNCALSAGQIAVAETYYRRAITANPKFGPALYGLAQIEVQRDNLKAARDYLNRYLNDYLGGEFPANAETIQTLQLAIRIERKLGNTKTAETYEQVLRGRLAPDRNHSSGPQTSPSR